MRLNRSRVGSLAVTTLLLSSASALAQDTAFRRDVQEAALKKHNEVRAKHGVPPLKGSAELQAVAQAWANKLAASGRMEHSTGGKYGENLYWTSASTRAGEGAALASASVQAWYDEVKDYDYGAPGFSMKTGHFTQVVWKNTTQVGCAAASGSKGTFVVCNYDPPGNYQGQFPEHVLKAR